MKRFVLVGLLAGAAALAGCKKKSVTNPNKLKLQTYTRKYKGEWKKFAKDMQFGSAFISNLQAGGHYLILSDKPGGCSQLNKPSGVRVSVALSGLSAEQKSGAKALPSNIKPAGAVIYTDGFNSMLMTTGAKTNKVSIYKGALKVGTEVTGSIDINDESKQPWRKGMFSLIQGDFKATVCAGKG